LLSVAAAIARATGCSPPSAHPLFMGRFVGRRTHPGRKQPPLASSGERLLGQAPVGKSVVRVAGGGDDVFLVDGVGTNSAPRRTASTCEWNTLKASKPSPVSQIIAAG
jgi:hypothetical protein